MVHYVSSILYAISRWEVFESICDASDYCLLACEVGFFLDRCM